MAKDFRFWIYLTAGFGLAAMGCESGGVGDPCVPEDEYQQDFSGYSETEVNIESRSFQCETRVCIVNHFRGRVSCPYGQADTAVPGGKECNPTPNPGVDDDGDGVDNATDMCPQQPGGLADGCPNTSALPSGSPNRCRIPGTRPDNPAAACDVNAINVPVQAQLKGDGRYSAVDQMVYCSCRCKNADGSKDDGARYCDCPSGFSCEKLVDDLGPKFGNSQLAGYYCIRENTTFDKRTVPGSICSPSLENCPTDGEPTLGSNPGTVQ